MVAKAPTPYHTDPFVRFGEWLAGRGYSPTTISRYVPHARRGVGDPIGYLRSITSWQIHAHARDTLLLYGEWTSAPPELLARIRASAGPLKPAPKPRLLIDFDEWRALGPAWLKRYPRELGHLLWCLAYSGLRRGDLATLTRDEAIAASRGQTVMRQKGRGGRRMRAWIPAAIVQPALAALCRFPGWNVVFRSVAGSFSGYCAAVTRAIPAPWTPHSFRRAFATYHHLQGVDDHTLCAMGGWESVATLHRYILLVPPSRIREANAHMSQALFPGGTPYDIRPVRPGAGRVG
jgi:integrase